MTNSSDGQPDAASAHPAPLPFTVTFDPRDEAEVLARWQGVLRSQRWSDGEQTREFESLWAHMCGREAVAFDNWAGGALAAFDFIGVEGATVLSPSNTFLATPRSAQKSGAHVIFYDCNREDLCGAAGDFIAKAEQHRPKAAWIVHVGGHIAFDIEHIAAYCREKGIWLIEDCAHAHGAHWNGRRAGSFGDAGIYSFYPTKTISTGEGGMLVTANPDLARHARSYRDYGRGSHYRIKGLNHRIHEFTAALGVVQTKRLDEIVAWKSAYAHRVLDPRYANRVHLPDGMVSGYYKYIVFEPLERSTGKVYEDPCHEIMKSGDILPNTEWIAKNHWCVPLYYPREGC
ncbi:dTDP-4-amino-4,6-dideoxygalactose transaminase [Chelatococcus asaccharovorans]|nr:dTDP-4-amino-4,6-dideoxygalactose transaminase [Chelatococcus asaccharovorans]CAH1685455.1 dTDP-4-amino-4,6-dideoxygalactose transaminase [Chelatococcus asaccharovorans]